MSTQQILLERALNHLQVGGLTANDWSLGGGTILSFRYQHRESRDIDIFFNTPQYLNFVSPRINDGSEGNLISYIETSKFVGLIFEEGKVDFISGPQVTPCMPKLSKLFGHEIYIDDSAEIIAKKIYYRGDYFKLRDFFDLAAAYLYDKEVLISNLLPLTCHLDIIRKRIGIISEDKLLSASLEKICILPHGEAIYDNIFELCTYCLNDVFLASEQGTA
jgi:hypothetical protein